MNKIMKDPAILLLIAVCISALLVFVLPLYVHTYQPGYVDSGYPLPWQRVYGGVTQQINWAFALMDFILWMFAAFAVLIAIFLGYYGDKK
ncbi:Uncharacterised protein [uncultured archaeon]|nr:Uncharacterised protein [uncultured archaeon]